MLSSTTRDVHYFRVFISDSKCLLQVSADGGLVFLPFVHKINLDKIQLRFARVSIKW